MADVTLLASFLDGLAAWATVGTALGTLVLAGATYALARQTRQLAVSSTQELDLLRQQTEAAQRQSVAAEEALRASVRPFILDVPPGTFREVRRDIFETLFARSRRDPPPPETKKVDVSIVRHEIRAEPENYGERAFWLEVPVRNVGNGVAVLEDAQLWLHGQGHVLGGTPAAFALPVDGVTTLSFEVTPGGPGWEIAMRAAAAHEDMTAAVTYTDHAEQQASRTELLLVADKDGLYEVEGVRVVAADEPFPPP